MVLPTHAPHPPSPSRRKPRPFSRTFHQRRKLLILIASAVFVSLLCLSTLHPAVPIEPTQHLAKLKDWGQDKADGLVDVLPEDGWGGKVKGWLAVEQGQGEKRECRDWDPRNREEDDPVGCLKAKQYRQTMRVLDREENVKHDRWYFTKGHNVETLRNISNCFLPVSDPSWTPCPEKPLILSGWWYTASTLYGSTSGEVIWQSAVLNMLKQLGYGYLAVGPYVNWVETAEMMPDVYHLLWNSELDTVACISDPRCVAKEHYVPPVDGEDLSIGVPDEERGVIPIWQLNVVDYWGARPMEVSNNNHWWGLTEHGEWSFQSLGQEWIATPWPLPGGHFHLPYSIEEECLELPMTPHEERRNAALLLAKRSSYFHMGHLSPMSFWTNLTSKDYELLSTAQVEEGKPLPEGLETLGKQTRPEYDKLVGDVKALVGMGAPPISPSVYVALCQGTPVVMPYFREIPELKGWDLYSGWSQHGPALALGEPYVYGYHAKNFTQLEDAIERAMSTEIGRYIPADMSLRYARSQLELYLSRDLEAMFHAVVRKNGGKVPALIKGIRERCYELKRCPPPLEAGRRPAKSWATGWTKGLEPETGTELEDRLVNGTASA